MRASKRNTPLITAVRAEFPRALWVSAFIVALSVAGSIGYRVIEGYSWADAIYMTAITVTAVGYHEVRPLTQEGRYWTMLLLGGGITALGMWFALLTSFVVRLDFSEAIRERKKMKRLSRISDHIIICGAGRMGAQVHQELHEAHKPCIIIDDAEEAENAALKVDPSVGFVRADATSDEALREAGVERASGLVACLSDDTDNLFVCLSAKALNPKLHVVARADNESTAAKMHRAGANHVVSPNIAGAVWVASMLTRPSVAALISEDKGLAAKSLVGSDMALRFEEGVVRERSPHAGKPLSEIGISERTGLIVVAVRKKGDGSRPVFNPDPQTVLEVGDQVVVIGRSSQIRRIHAHLA